MKTCLIAAALATATVVRADEEVTEDAVVVDDVFSVPSTGAAFVETFQEDPFQGRWVQSTNEKYTGQAWDWGAAKAASGKYLADKVSHFTHISTTHPLPLPPPSSSAKAVNTQSTKLSFLYSPTIKKNNVFFCLCVVVDGRFVRFRCNRLHCRLHLPLLTHCYTARIHT